MVSPMVVVALKRKYRGARLISSIALAVYIVFICKYFFFPIVYDKDVFFDHGNSLQLIPFIPFYDQILSVGWKQFLYQAFGNILAFIPIMFLLVVINPKCQKFRYCLSLSLGISIAIELIQLGINLITGNTNRIVDINDVLLNTIGGIIGYFVFLLWRRLDLFVKKH